MRLAGLEFKSKKEAQEYVRGRLTQFDESDPLWLDLLERHPEKEEKRGSGVKRFFVTKNPLNKKALQLNIERVDGSVTDISWRYCIEAKAMTTDLKLTLAMRNAIADQTNRAKKHAWHSKFTCPLCATPCHDFQGLHIDHYPVRFEVLAKTFISICNIPAPTEFDDCPKSNMPKFKREDEAFSARWQIYHAVKASLRAICAHCNLTQKRTT